MAKGKGGNPNHDKRGRFASAAASTGRAIGAGGRHVARTTGRVAKAVAVAAGRHALDVAAPIATAMAIGAGVDGYKKVMASRVRRQHAASRSPTGPKVRMRT